MNKIKLAILNKGYQVSEFLKIINRKDDWFRTHREPVGKDYPFLLMAVEGLRDLSGNDLKNLNVRILDSDNTVTMSRKDITINPDGTVILNKPEGPKNTTFGVGVFGMQFDSIKDGRSICDELHKEVRSSPFDVSLKGGPKYKVNEIMVIGDEWLKVESVNGNGNYTVKLVEVKS